MEAELSPGMPIFCGVGHMAFAYLFQIFGGCDERLPVAVIQAIVGGVPLVGTILAARDTSFSAGSCRCCYSYCHSFGKGADEVSQDSHDWLPVAAPGFQTTVGSPSSASASSE